MQLGAFYLEKLNGLIYTAIDVERRICSICKASWIDVCRLDSGALSALPAEADALIISPGASRTGAHYAKAASSYEFLPTRSIGRPVSYRGDSWAQRFGHDLADAILLQRVTSTTPEMAKAHSFAHVVATFAADYPRKHDRAIVALTRDKHGGKIDLETLPLQEVICHHCHYGLILSEGNRLGYIAWRAYSDAGIGSPRLGAHQIGVSEVWLSDFHHPDFDVSGEGHVYARGSIFTITSEDGHAAHFAIRSDGETYEVEAHALDILINPDSWRPIDRPGVEKTLLSSSV